MALYKVQYAQKVNDNYNERNIYHFETDSSVIIMEGMNGMTLEEFAKQIDGKRTITLSGGVTGKVETDGHSAIVIDTTVTDDSHRHTGATLDVGDPERVVVTDTDGAVVSSEISLEELNALSGIKGNIQDALDAKVKASELNGNLLVDGEELTVYEHPLKVESDEDDPIIKVLDEGVAEPELLTRDKIVQIFGNVTVDNAGHLETAEAKSWKMPAYSQFYLTSTEPTGQVAGDFWLETLSVEVGNNEFYMEDWGGNKADTQTVGEKSEDLFSMTDLDTLETAPAGAFNLFSMSDL